MKTYPVSNGVATFEELEDTDSYSGQGSKFVKVKTGADGLEYATGSGGAAWGSITGTLGDQTDLQTELNGKADTSHNQAASTINSGTFVDGRVAESNVTQHQAALSITESQISDLSHFGGAVNDLSDAYNATPADKHVLVYDGVTDNRYENRLLVEADISDLQSYLTAETNDLSAAVTWANVPDANITQSSVTQHEAALSIAESQISDLGTYVDTSGVPVLNDFAKFTDADTIEGRSYAEARSDLGLVIGTDVQAHAAVLDATTASFTTADETKLDGIEASADVTDTTNVTSAGALMDSEVDADIKTLALPANTTISAFGATVVDDADAAAVRTTLDVDQAGTDNSTDVTITGTPDYITITGQVITRNQVDLANDITGNLPVSALNSGTGASSSTFWRGDGTWQTPAGGGSTDLVPYVVTDGVGGQTASTTAVTVNLDTVAVSNSGYSLATDEVTITDAGDYWISFQVTWNQQANEATTRDGMEAFVEYDSGGGYNTVNQLYCYRYFRESSGNQSAGTASALTIAASGKLRLRYKMTAGTAGDYPTVADRTHLSIMKVA